MGYLFTLPERILRALAAGLGGLLYETSEVLLPTWIRHSRLYQAVIARLMRITVELIGGVKGVLPPEEIDARELAMRKAAGNVIEVASFLAVGWSPLWLLAAAADLTGGTQTYLRALVAELQRDGLLTKSADITSVEELLTTLEGTSGAMADLVDIPPLNLPEIRRSLGLLKKNAGELPDANRLANLFQQLQETARHEGRSLRQVSGLLAASAMRAGVQMGHVYVFDYYRQSLKRIQEEGLAAYTRRVSRPYLATALGHFDARRGTRTGNLVGRFRSPPDR